jgi:hypothetical protein
MYSVATSKFQTGYRYFLHCISPNVSRFELIRLGVNAKLNFVLENKNVPNEVRFTATVIICE